ncbi:phosphate ABC transporter permease subunit PstC [Halosimplex aquaticum]|uniref:Phosphate transport system permease protein n=1 Tax=Halosimplex aquaticum TaxID=3026162 RepID=A0ABD5YA10_9EURY|nr:phosphate ABC transporter permease subunit PstC [Halosimplex aquaticum]
MQQDIETNRNRFSPGDDGSYVVMGVMGCTLAATVVAFLFRPGLVAPLLAAFLVSTAVGWLVAQAVVARALGFVATVSTVLTVAFITYFLFVSAAPAFLEHGRGLFIIPVQDGRVQWFFGLDAVLPTSDEYWNPAADAYSLIPAIWATVIVTVIAGSVAGPLGLFGALFIAEVASDGLRSVVKPGVEVLAGIPSIVYGFIGFQVLNGFVQNSFLDDGASYLIAGIVVGIMALPTVVSVAEDAISSVPGSMRDGSTALGATRWQTMKSISIPASFSGVSAAVILGLGRAIGETMAVAAIMASGTGLANPLYDVFDASVTLTSLIATQYGSASESTLDVLFAAGVLLFVIVAGMSVVSQAVERRMKRKLRGER